MKLPPSIEDIVWSRPLSLTVEGHLVLAQRIAHEACRLQRDADNEHRVTGRAGQAPLVVEEPSEEHIVKTLAPQFRGIPKLDIDARPGVEIDGRSKLERRIVWNLLKHLEANGWRVSCAFDGDDWYTKPSADAAVLADPDTEEGRAHLTAKEAMEVTFNLDEVSLRFTKSAPRAGLHQPEHGVWIVLGNGIDCIADWNFTDGDDDGFDAVMSAFDTSAYE